MTVNNTSAASTVWVSTIDGTAIAGEDYVPVLNKEVNFTQGGSTSQTVTVNLLRVSSVSGGTNNVPLISTSLRKVTFSLNCASLPVTVIFDIF